VGKDLSAKRDRHEKSVTVLLVCTTPIVAMDLWAQFPVLELTHCTWTLLTTLGAYSLHYTSLHLEPTHYTRSPLPTPGAYSPSYREVPSGRHSMRVHVRVSSACQRQTTVVWGWLVVC
jgi:hypothetical protein